MDVEPATPPPELPAPAQPAPEPAVVARDDGPVPMSFPAILRAPGIGSDRFAHLRAGRQRVDGVSAPVSSGVKKRDDKAGKRWVRRKDNARFVGNPHIVAASSKDYAVPTPNVRATFPEPLPVYLSRNTPLPPSVVATREPVSANAGRFSMSLKGMRRELRKSGPRTEVLVKEIEEEVMGWLAGGVLLDPDVVVVRSGDGEEGMPVGSTGGIVEVSRTPLQLVLLIREDAFARYVVHCCARYHSIVSFTAYENERAGKDTSGQRLTYLLRPNVTRPDFFVTTAIATPPATESEMSTFDVESDFADTDMRSDVTSLHSSHDVDSDNDSMDGAPPVPHPQGQGQGQGQGNLSDIAESLPGSPTFSPAQSADGWSVVGDSEEEGGHSDLVSSVDSLSLSDHRTPRSLAPGMLRATHLWDRSRRRSASSPSRSPARRLPARHYHTQLRVDPLPSTHPAGRSFHEYLYA
ncbi:hypothetical protein EUX98_g8281 [Antrodiella citrinella]|uniref:Uncharacterized protein n=1 Tax=Antrodiella citrinella TaxID=2447956 RepID=A0A4V3XGK5_9APHY|nr:hypothetical protein EUX98_g8281 [Antrodiella citrinella]